MYLRGLELLWLSSMQMCAPDHVIVMTSNSALLDELLRLHRGHMVYALGTIKYLENWSSTGDLLC